MAGLALTAATLTWAAGSWINARRAKVWTLRSATVGGLMLVALGIAVSGSTAYSEVPVIAAAVGWGIGGLGMGIAWQTMTLTVLSEARRRTSGLRQRRSTCRTSWESPWGRDWAGAIVAAGESAGWGMATSVGTIFAMMFVVALLAVLTAARLPGRVTSPA